MPRLQNVYVISIHRSAICKSNKGKFSRVRPDDILSELLAKSFNLSGLSDILVNKNKNKNKNKNINININTNTNTNTNLLMLETYY